MPNPCVGMKVKDNGFEHKKRRVKSAREKHHGLISFRCRHHGRGQVVIEFGWLLGFV